MTYFYYLFNLSTSRVEYVYTTKKDAVSMVRFLTSRSSVDFLVYRSNNHVVPIFHPKNYDCFELVSI